MSLDCRLHHLRGLREQTDSLSRSSIGTLPVTEAVTETRLGVPRAYAAFAW